MHSISNQGLSFWCGVCGGLLIALVCTLAYMFVQGPRGGHGASGLNANVPTTDSSPTSQVNFRTVSRLGQSSEFISTDLAIEILESPNLHTLDEIAAALDTVLQDVLPPSQVLEMLESVNNEDFRRVLQQVVLDQELEESGFESVFFSLSTNLDESLKQRILKDLISITARAHTKPLYLIDVVAQTPDEKFRDDLFETLVLTWAKSDAHELHKNLDIFPSEWVRRFGLFHSSLGIARTMPQKAIDLLPEFEGTLLEDLLVSELAQGVALSKPLEAMSWIASTEDIRPEMKKIATTSVLLSLTDNHPEYAYERAFARISDAKMVLKKIAQKDLELAMKLHSKNLESDKSIPLSILLGEVMLDQQEFNEALSLGNRVPGRFQQHFFDTIFSKWSSFSPKTLYGKIPSLPTELQVRASMQLLATQQTIPVFKPEEIEFLRSLIPKQNEESYYELVDLLTSANDWRLQMFLSNGEFKIISGKELYSSSLRAERAGERR